MSAIAFDNSYARLPDQFYANVAPASVPKPQLIRLNADLADELGMNSDWLRSDDGVAMLSGNRLPCGVQPIAQALPLAEMQSLMAEVSKNGDARRGQEVYRRTHLLCQTCHRWSAS